MCVVRRWVVVLPVFCVSASGQGWTGAENFPCTVQSVEIPGLRDTTCGPAAGRVNQFREVDERQLGEFVFPPTGQRQMQCRQTERCPMRATELQV